LPVLAGVYWLTRPAPAAPALTPTRLFEQVFAKVRSSAVDPLEDAALYRLAAIGVIRELDDPYATLQLPGEAPLPPSDAPVAQGIYLDRRDGLIVVVATVAGSPGAAAGLAPGDRLVAVDSTTLDATRMQRAPALLAGPEGSAAVLRVRRTGVRNTLSLRLVRGPEPAPAPSRPLEGSLLEGGVAHLRVSRFDSGTAEAAARLLDSLRRAGARSVVLDLRSTVGGELEAGVALADLFLSRGRTLATTRARAGAPALRFDDAADSPFAEMPAAVLIDAGSAGAAEVVAGALQDHDRAAVLGSSSFGRGVTRSTFALGDGVTLGLTTALWITPSGRQIQRPPLDPGADSVPRPIVRSSGGRELPGGGGIVPDRQVEPGTGRDAVLAEARRLLQQASRPEEVLALLTPK
jgi:carboxyl-terminal processing protease